jgi:hypothetical protein
MDFYCEKMPHRAIYDAKIIESNLTKMVSIKKIAQDKAPASKFDLTCFVPFVLALVDWKPE